MLNDGARSYRDRRSSTVDSDGPGGSPGSEGSERRRLSEGARPEGAALHAIYMQQDHSSSAVDQAIPWIAALRIAIAADPHPEHRVEHASTIALLDRYGRSGTGDLSAAWNRFAVASTGLLGRTGWELTVGVMANAIALVEYADAADYATTSDLVQRHGHRVIAAIQTTVDDLLDTGPAMPVATHVAAILGLSDQIVAKLKDAGTSQSASTEIAQRCHRTGFRLVMTGVNVEAPGPRLSRPQELADLWNHGGIQAWRGQLAIISANPWSRYAVDVNKLAVAANHRAAAYTLAEATNAYRERNERREREEVGREIKALVASSGLNQRQFASAIGTSASRLSTYVNGLVTPSASMMVRMRRVSDTENQWMQDARLTG